jgi:hypothetical protein
MYFQREPAVIIALIAGLVQVVSAFIFHWTDEQQGTLNAALGLTAGIVVAAMVSLDKAVPLVGGFVQAVFSVGLAFGWELDPVAQSAVMALVSALVGAFTRTQVTAGPPAVEAARREG